MSDWFTRAIPALYRRSGAARLFSLPATDPLFTAAFFAYKRLAEDPFAALVRCRPALFRGGDIFDIGANAGYTSVVFAGAASPGARVFAFEPEAVNLRRLRRVIRRRGLEAVVFPQPVAAGAEDGAIGLAVSPTHPGDHWVSSSAGRAEGRGVVPVPMRSVDSLAAEHGLRQAKFIKIDVQGYELEVSRGMERLLAQSPDVAVAFEYAPEDLRRFGLDAAELIGFYRSRGFRLHLLSRDMALPEFTEAAAAGTLAHREYVDILALRSGQ